MDFDLPPELAELQASVRKLAQERVAPRAREIDLTEEYPEDLFELFVETGLAGLCVPEEYGGSGAGILGLAIAIEEVAKYSNAAALMLLLTRLPTGPLLIAGSEAMKHRYLTPITTGEQRAAFGLSEPQAGSDVMGMRTKAVRDGGDWILTGTKCWMSGVRQADWYCVFAKTGPVESRAHDSVTAFVVERQWDGVSVGRVDKKMGVKGVDTGELLLDGVRVPAENVVGDIGGFRLCMLGLNAMRPIVAARGIGLAEGALMYAVDYAKQREAFTQDGRGLPGHPVEDRRARHRDRGGAPAHVPRRVDGGSWAVHQGVRALPLDVQVLRDRARGEDEQPRAPDARSRGVHAGPSDGALLPGREAAHHRRGDVAGAARPDREGCARPRSLVGLAR